MVPAAINYSDFFHYRGTCELVYGEPMDVNAFLAVHGDLAEGARYQAFLEELSGRMSALIAPDVPSKRLPTWLCVVLFPLWLVAAVLALPMWFPAEWLCARKVKDRAFHNTVRFGFRLLGGPVTFIIWSALFFCLLPWWLALVLLLAFIPSYSLFYDYLLYLRK